MVADAEETIELFPEEYEAVLLFSRVQTQWNAGMGGITGLNYLGVEAVARNLRVSLDADMFSRIQIMERGVLSEVSRRREAERKRNANRNRSVKR